MFNYPTKQTPDPDAANSHGIPDEEPVGSAIDPKDVQKASADRAKEADVEKKAEEKEEAAKTPPELKKPEASLVQKDIEGYSDPNF